MTLFSRLRRLNPFRALTTTMSSISQPSLTPQAPYAFSKGAWSPRLSPPMPIAPAATLNIITYNVDFMTPNLGPRILAVLTHLESILPSPPTHTILIFQELDFVSWSALQSCQWVRDNFQLSNTTAVGGYFTSSLATLDIPVAAVTRVGFERSNMGRDVLLLDVALQGGGVLRVANTHLESLREPGVRLRPIQLSVVAELLKAEGVVAGIVGGDMNAIQKEDKDLPERVGLGDVWELQKDVEEEEGYTWGFQPPSRFPPGRLDKVLFTGDVEFLEVQEGRRLRRVGVGLEYTPPINGEERVVGWQNKDDGRNWASDHYGLWVRVRVGGQHDITV